MRRAWLVDGFCARSIACGWPRLLPGGVSKPPGFSMIRYSARHGAAHSGTAPYKASSARRREAEAAELQVKNGFKTRTQVTGSRAAQTGEENVTQLAREKRTACRANGGCSRLRPHRLHREVMAMKINHNEGRKP